MLSIKFYWVKQSLDAYLEYLTWLNKVHIEKSVEFYKIKEKFFEKFLRGMQNFNFCEVKKIGNKQKKFLSSLY